MPTIFNKKAKPTPHVIRVDEEPLAPPALPREHQALPLDPRIKLDARIRAECVEIVDTNDLVVNDRNAKKHPERQIALLCANIEEFGFTTPLLVDERNKIIAGHARYAAAKRIGLTHLPVVRLDAPYASTKARTCYLGQQAGRTGLLGP
ncbi:ParB N-terminal domain-containing protein [Bradyrhizobium sp. 4]|uniref:ParB/Srx family N-terminal domain-containing protein n=1 Tax=unclassified Bradyrhizobium TaxID=2631580 RepID=UPI001FF72751|nr:MULTISPECIES: ParB/Srx family N-terminal domain-containing protein [unclassified Bradyrhizobium]MCK1403204.1 ParB N-terminal domain-containing protein [Bradyrhizobium sp. 39]MCK1748800.1 ParB N-terminal domain-containing protein [Bradyrhizobium sp. 135]UPJ33241.1 ParB N-terminal domain-containing protein [Bradyrhizobium sp. 4]